MAIILSHLRLAMGIFLLAALVFVAFSFRDAWLTDGLSHFSRNGDPPHAPSPASTSPVLGKVLLSDQAIANLGLLAKPVRPTVYWRTIQIPGSVVDRPGLSDRGIVAPVSGVVARVHHIPGESVKSGDTLFTIRVLSESIHATQAELFKSTQEIALAQAQKSRLMAASGAVSEARVFEVESQITRLETAVKAYRRELFTRGLDPKQINEVAEGKFVREIQVMVPTRSPPSKKASEQESPTGIAVAGDVQVPYEVQELKVDLGQQVNAGQTLCLLANHHLLSVEGRAFRDETHLLERSVNENWPVEIDFQEDLSGGWAPLKQAFHIRYLANMIDPVNRTFAFQMPLENEAKFVNDQGRTQILWRFRPGQKVRIHVRVERIEDVFVLPADAVARDGLEAFVFTQNVNTFLRKAVRVLTQDRQKVVLANDGNLVPGSYVVQSAAAQLNRMAKGQSGGAPAGYHIHADGSLHKNGEEEK